MTHKSRVRVPVWGKVLWGIGVVILNVALAAGLLRYSHVFRRLDLFAASVRVDPAPAAVLVSAAFSVAIVSLVALAGSIAHLWLWSGFSLPKRLGWLVMLLLGAQPGLMLYWLFNVAHEPVDSPALEGAA